MTKKSNKCQHHVYPKHLHRGTKIISQNITGENVVFLKVSVQIVISI